MLRRERVDGRVFFWENGLTSNPFLWWPQWRRHVTGLLCAYGVVPVFEKWHRRLENEGDGNIPPSAWNAQWRSINSLTLALSTRSGPDQRRTYCAAGKPR